MKREERGEVAQSNMQAGDFDINHLNKLVLHHNDDRNQPTNSNTN